MVTAQEARGRYAGPVTPVASSVVEVETPRRSAAILWGIFAAGAAGLAVGCALYVNGTSPIALVVLALVPWPLAGVQKLGWSLSLGAPLAGATVGALAVAVIAQRTGIPLADAYVVSLAVAGAAGWWLAARGLSRRQVALPRGLAWWVGAPAFLWMLLVAIAEFLPGASRVSWAMQGDSSNNMLFARDIVQANGFPLDGTNPVPMTHVLLSVVFAPHEALDASARVAADLTAAADLWHLVLAASSLLWAAFAWTFVTQSTDMGRRFAAVAAMVTGAMPLTWLYTGMAVHFGFFNLHLLLVLVIAALLVGLDANRAPAEVFSIEALLSLALALAWTPMAILPAVIGCVVLVSPRATTVPRSQWIVAALVVLGCGVVVVSVVSGQLSGEAGALSADGGIFPIPRWWCVALPVLVAAFVARGSRRKSAARMTLMSTVIGMVIALVAVNALAGFAWSYYPQKLGWIFTILAASLAPVLVASIASSLLGWKSVRGLGVVMAMVFLAIALGPAVRGGITGTWMGSDDPWSMILLGRVAGDGDAEYEAVVSLASDESVTVLMAGNPSLTDDDEDHGEGEANFWVVNLFSQRFDPVLDEDRRFATRSVAYALLDGSPTALCGLPEIAGVPVVVIAEDPAVGAAITEACPHDDITVTRP